MSATPLYILSAFDDGATPFYTAEAYVAACSVRRHTAAPIRLLTSEPRFVERLAGRPDFPFTDVTTFGTDALPKAHKIRAIGEAGEAPCIFLDTDTIVLADISRVFEMAPFEVAGVPAPGRDAIDGMDDAVRAEATFRHHLNSGVLWIAAGYAERLADRWRERFRRATARGRVTAFDQPALHAALADLGTNVFALPPNYNFRVNFGGLLSGACFVLHTHYRHDLMALLRADLAAEAVDRLIDRAAAINASTATGVVQPAGSRSLMRADLRRHGWRRGLGDRLRDALGR
jgi:hypothetical protein